MSASSTSDQATGELLYGVRSIADFLGVSPWQALYLTERRAFPFCARRGTIQAWMTEREQAAELGRRVAS